MQIALSSDEECSQEEFRLDSKEFFLSMDPAQFQNLCKSLGNNFTLDFPPPTGQPQPLEMEDLPAPIVGDIDDNVTPCCASHVPTNALGFYPSQPLFLASQISTPKP